MKTIWKYPIPLQSEFDLIMPIDAIPLTTQMQGDQPCLWALVESTNTLERRVFYMIETEHYIPKTIGPYVGTFQAGPLVFHVFEEYRLHGHSNNT